MEVITKREPGALNREKIIVAVCRSSSPHFSNVLNITNLHDYGLK